jgi:hypothetical protein
MVAVKGTVARNSTFIFDQDRLSWTNKELNILFLFLLFKLNPAYYESTVNERNLPNLKLFSKS